jgi:hypothetical protein
MYLDQVPIDELWTFIRKKKETLQIKRRYYSNSNTQFYDKLQWSRLDLTLTAQNLLIFSLRIFHKNSSSHSSTLTVIRK